MRQYCGRRKDNGEWVYGYLIGSDVIVGEIVQFCDEYFNTEYWWKVDPDTVGKWTGLSAERSIGMSEYVRYGLPRREV